MKEEKYVNISTKVKPETDRLLTKICKKLGFIRYEFLQNVCECVTRYTSDKYNLTPELERLMGMFEHLKGWKNAFNLADHTAEAEICEAFYVLKAKGKNGLRMIQVERPWWDGVETWKQNINIQTMFDRFLNIIMPERYMKMRKLHTCSFPSKMKSRKDTNASLRHLPSSQRSDTFRFQQSHFLHPHRLHSPLRFLPLQVPASSYP